jgi:hypothetical protein
MANPTSVMNLLLGSTPKFRQITKLIFMTQEIRNLKIFSANFRTDIQECDK